MRSVRIEGNLRGDVARRAAQSLHGELEVTVGDCIEIRSFDAGDALQMASVVAGVIQGVAVVMQFAGSAATRRKWSRTRVMEVLAEELMKKGVTSFEVESVADYDHLLERSSSPCTVSVVDKLSRERMRFLLFSDGDAIILRGE